MLNSIALRVLVLAVLLNGVAVADEPNPAAPPPPEIKVGMRIKSTYAGAHYPGTLKEIKDRNTYVIRSDGSENDSTVEAWRLQTADGVDFLDLIKDPQRMAQRARDKVEGRDYYVGLWSTGNNPVILTTKTETKPNGTVVETKEINLARVSGWLQIKADGTYAHKMYGKTDTYTGAWVPNPDPKETSIILRKAHLAGGDLRATRQPLGTILLQEASLGGAGYTGTIIPPEVVEAKEAKETKPEERR